MTNNEKQFLEESILKVISDNNEGFSIEIILEYLDYINRISYQKEKIVTILKELIQEQKISRKGNIFIPINKPLDF